MVDIMAELRREGRVFTNGMADVVPIAHPRWKVECTTIISQQTHMLWLAVTNWN